MSRQRLPLIIIPPLAQCVRGVVMPTLVFGTLDDFENIRYNYIDICKITESLIFIS